MAADGSEAAPGTEDSDGDPVLPVGVPESVGVLTLVTAVELLPMEDAPVPEAVPIGTGVAEETLGAEVITVTDVSVTSVTYADDEAGAVSEGVEAAAVLSG